MPVDIDIKNDKRYGVKKINIRPQIQNGQPVYNDRKQVVYTYDREDKYVVNTKNFDQSDLFFVVTHRELNLTKDKEKRHTTYLTFISKTLNIKSQDFIFSDDNKLQEVNIYFPKSGETETPLVIVITTNTSHCYFFSRLKYLKHRKEIKNLAHFKHENLLDKLIEENNKQNNVITYRIDKKSSTDGLYDGVTVVKEPHPSFEKYKHTRTSSKENTPAYVLYTGQQISLESKSQFSGKDTKLNKIQGRYYCELTVYFFKRAKGSQPQNLPIFLVLEENSNSYKYCLQRINQNGLKWKQIQDPGLDTVITYLIEQRPKQPESYNNSIDVTYQTHNSFNVYEHKPQSPHAGKKSYLLFGFQFIERLKNDGYEGVPKLENIQLHKYSQVLVYFFKSETSNFYSEIPIYLELEEKREDGQTPSSTKYYLQRTDSQAISWKQINKTDLTNTITFLLEQKKETVYNNNVNVSRGKHISFDVYIHKPKEENKLGLLLYNSSLIVLNSNKLPDGVEKLGNLEWQNYSEISVYHFKLSSSKIADLPTYIELKINDPSKESTESDPSNTKTYYLKPDGSNAIYWTQISDPKLNEIITFLLDKRPSNTSDTYNDGSIRVTEETDTSFRVITHSPVTEHENKTAILLYNDHYLELVPNVLIPPEKKFNEFDGKTYCSVSLFYYNTSGQDQKPAFLELQVKGSSSGGDQQVCDKSSKCYLFQIADEQAIKWTQVEYQNLRNTVTYQLDFKSDGQSYNGGSVTVNKAKQDSFDVYTHTPNNTDYFGLLLYKWKMLTLQPNYDPQLPSKLEKLHGKKYCKVAVYWPTKSGDQPLFLELFENKGTDGLSQCADTTSSNIYWLQRVDPDGHHWMQNTKVNENLGTGKALEIIEDIRNNNKYSIMVQLTETSRYDIKLIQNYRTDGIGQATNPPNIIYTYHNTLMGSNYKYYNHTFPGSTELAGLNIDSLRTFIKYTEIKIYDNLDKMKTIYYKPETDTSKKFQVFFYSRDNLPLMLLWENNPYSSNKNDYFTKWKPVTHLKSPNPEDRTSREQIKKELDKINKQFNEILLDQTDPPGYGISLPPTGKPPSSFSLTRVRTEKVEQSSRQNFGKVTHQTVNNSSIGLIKFKKHVLLNDQSNYLSQEAIKDKAFSNSIVNSVSAYYHSTDQSYKKPLLLGFTKLGSNRFDIFYEREHVGDTSNWKKIDSVTDLRNNDGLADKINNIHYNIGKSFVIQVDHQGQDGSGSASYPVKLVDNKVGGSGTGTTPAGGDQNITVSKNSCNNPSVIEYTCFTHQIPSLTGPDYVSGLKLYICDTIYLKTFDKGGSSPLPIYYESDKRDVKVYFYGGNSNGNPPLDKIPLLVQYEETYFKPSSRNGYFANWVKTVIPEGDGRGDTGTLPQIGKVLEDINKELNTIELDNTGGGNNTKYGIKPPELSESPKCGTGSKTDVSTFCERVTVTRETGLDGEQFYKKVTHKTVNQGPIGNFMYEKQPVTGIKAMDIPPGSNKVEVFYGHTDKGYGTPLLIRITSEKTGSSRSTCKWYSKKGVKPTDWNDADNISLTTQDATSDKIKQELEKIQVSLSNYLHLDISRQSHYTGYVQKGSENTSKQSIGTINSTASYGGIDGQTLSNPLTYGPEDEGKGSTHDPFVYFYEGQGHGASDDTVPLLFKYGDKFFGPKDKANYFKSWHEVIINIHGGQEAKNIKSQLDKINELLNEVDLSNKGDRDEHEYGLDKGGTTDLGDFKTERIKVNKEEKTVNQGKKYRTITHSTVNRYNIGPLKDLSSSCKFDNKHNEELKEQIHNEAVAIYASDDTSTLGTPKLVLIAETKRGTSTVHGYYDLSKECRGQKSEFKKVKAGLDLKDIEKREAVQKSCQQLVEILTNIGIVKEVQQIKVQEQSGQFDSRQGRDGTLRQQDLDAGQDDRPKVAQGARDGLGGSGSLGAGTKDSPDGAGLDEKPGEQGPEGEPGQHPSPLTRTEHSDSSSSLPTNGDSTTHGSEELQRTTGGGGNDRSRNGGEASPSSPEPGSNDKPGLQGIEGNKGSGENTNGDNI